jgi:ABC-type multidrug transport system fused ATPase/permease subunit
MLFKFLYRNLKGYRFLIFIAIAVLILQVGADLLAAMPLKWIPSKVSNPGSDPACTFSFLNPALDMFDKSIFDPSLKQIDPQHLNVQLPDKQPPLLPCPITSTTTQTTTVQLTHHSVNGVIIFSALWLILFGLVSALLAYIALYLASFIAQNLTVRLRRQLFEHLQRLSLDWHGKQKKGDLVQRVTGDIANIEKLVTDGLVDLLASGMILVGVTIIMFFISPQYTLLAVAIAPVLFIIVLGYTKGIKAATKKAAKAAGQVANVANEDIGAITVLKAFTLEEREALRFKRYVGKNREAGMRAGSLQAQFTPLVSILGVLVTAIIIGVGGYVAASNAVSLGFFSIGADTVDVGTLILFLVYVKMWYQPMRDLSKLANLASSAGSGAERIQEVLDQAPEVIETTAPYYGPQKLKGDIIFERVNFGYMPGRPVLKGINLHIPIGKKVALVGLSGGGKTTLIKLIARLYEIQQGLVKIDGVDNRLYPLAILRQNVSLVLQDNILFEGTIHENIEIGKPGASLEEIIDAAKKAYIHDTIMSFPGGYETEVREQGKNFSGGQRQRLAIARAVLRDAPILILDEPTAALDVEAEAEVMHALDKLVVGRTVLMISHRLSTLGNVDQIIVLKEGVIAEQGTFKELKRKGGVFATLLDEQNRYNMDRAASESIIRSVYAPLRLPQDQHQVPPPYAPGMPPAPMTPSPWSPPAPSPAPVPVGAPPPSRTPRDGNGRQQEQPLLVSNPQQAINSRQQQQGAFNQKARVLIEVDAKVIGARELNKPLLTVGRLSGNDVQVPSQRVSRLHAKILWENGSWAIEDADSLNGLNFQGQRIERRILSPGDRVYLAPTAALQYEIMV